MTDTEQHVVVRLKKGGFTKSAPALQAFTSLIENLPFDKIYFVQPADDGGYTLREAGTLVVNIIPSVDAPSIQVPQDERSQTQVSQPIHTPPPQVENTMAGNLEPRQQSFEFTNDFKFTKPKSQTELLAAAGVKEPRVDMRTKATRDLPEVEVEGTEKPKRSKRTAATKAKMPRRAAVVKVEEPNLDGDDWDKGLPAPVKTGPGKTKITGFRIATQAEAAVASHFNPSAFMDK